MLEDDLDPDVCCDEPPEELVLLEESALLCCCESDALLGLLGPIPSVDGISPRIRKQTVSIKILDCSNTDFQKE